MHEIVAVAFAFVTGMTIAGVAGSLFELSVGSRLSFAPPFFDRSRRFLVVAAVLASGPLMLTNDVLEAWRARRVASPFALCCLATAVAWVMALGIVALGVMSELT